MGMIVSRVAEVEKSHFTIPPKNRVMKCDSVVRIDEADYMVKLANGQLIHVHGRNATPNGNVAIMGYGLDRASERTLRAMVAIGAITQQQMDEHVNQLAASRDARERARAKEQLTLACTTLGIPTPFVEDKQ